MTDCTSITKWVHRHRWVELDGTEHEEVRVRNAYNLSVDDVEALGHEALKVAAEWQQEIAERVPTPPTHKVFAFTSCNGRDTKIATWVEHPWALVRFGNGTMVAFLVKEQSIPGSVSSLADRGQKNADGRLRGGSFGLRAQPPSVNTICSTFFQSRCRGARGFGDLEYARANAQRGAA